ncbi:hypothetical protein MPH_13864 [Macrophomina phaseolina MS6]|uniref:Uncharacterized protein n=1 Tax=Macrophomina phaseolina (strain MS6) TaxID=1126212 RepID=K2R8B1_MACPH|nr:hypothetical protein MPH_13864 [Macrophomina phaseolina MS6]
MLDSPGKPKSRVFGLKCRPAGCTSFLDVIRVQEPGNGTVAAGHACGFSDVSVRVLWVGAYDTQDMTCFMVREKLRTARTKPGATVVAEWGAQGGGRDGGFRHAQLALKPRCFLAQCCACKQNPSLVWRVPMIWKM